MEYVDFDYVGEGGFTIYRRCLQKYIRSRYTLQKPEAEWSKLVKETETVFYFLLEKGLENGFNVDLILEMPDSYGSTCFLIASDCSRRLSSYWVNRVIRLNSITTDMNIARFTYPELSIKMMQNGINPYVIDCHGYSQIDRNPSSFKSDEAKRLLATFPRSVHFSIEDIKCTAKCSADCPSKFEKFYYKNGPLVQMTDENRVGIGGFGMVFKAVFHGIPMAMKCMLMGKIEHRKTLKETISDLEKNISELRIQIATAGSGIIVPVAFVRQQNQEQDSSGKWIAMNYNIYIYPLYDCDLYQLHENNFDRFTEVTVANIIHQCFIRIGSHKNSYRLQLTRSNG